MWSMQLSLLKGQRWVERGKGVWRVKWEVLTHHSIETRLLFLLTVHLIRPHQLSPSHVTIETGLLFLIWPHQLSLQLRPEEVSILPHCAFQFHY